MSTVSVFGSTGFLGRRSAQRLVAEGTTVRVAVRHADRARSALRATPLDRVTFFGADVCDQAGVATAVAGVDIVVDAVSAYVETGGATFEPVHERGAGTLAREAAAAGVARFVLVSGIGADPESGLRRSGRAPWRTHGPASHVRALRRAVRHARPPRYASWADGH